MDVFTVAIRALDPTGLSGDAQPDTRMTKRALSAVAGNAVAFDNLCLWRLYRHGWPRFYPLCRSSSYGTGNAALQEVTNIALSRARLIMLNGLSAQCSNCCEQIEHGHMRRPQGPANQQRAGRSPLLV